MQLVAPEVSIRHRFQSECIRTFGRMVMVVGVDDEGVPIGGHVVGGCGLLSIEARKNAKHLEA